ncbi:MAG: uroporphyrinogen decarboxylase family protein [Actinomycetota bacterium]|nr:uroporphyrinogen decarboxylase family protein [Actinomycetota bacterium]
MKRRNLIEIVQEKYKDRKRVVAPLLGFPGVDITGSNIKVAQQNYGEHYKVMKKLVEMFEPDIIFPLMDLSVEANALGRYTVFPKEESATVPKDKFIIDDIQKIRDINISLDSRIIGYVNTVKLMRLGLDEKVLKGAYVIGPYSLAALIMGADEAAICSLLEPDKLTRLCELTVEKIHEYVNMLVTAGAEVICVLEPTAVMLGPEQFREFSAKYVKHIVDSCKFSGVSTIYHTCGNTTHLVNEMANSGVDGISLDSKEVGVDLREIAKILTKYVLIIGNVNPNGVMLRGKPEDVKKDVNDLMEMMDPYPNFILSTGCDLPQETPLENIKAFMDVGRSYKIK